MALAELEPIHRKIKRQHTETDLMMRGFKNLIMVEVKLGYQRKEIDGWLQAKSSPVVQAYQPHAMPLMNNPDTWRLSVERFAQLYKNLMLGRLLAKEWSNTEGPLLVHLLVIVNGETKDKNGRTYLDEFELFRQGCALPQTACTLLLGNNYACGLILSIVHNWSGFAKDFMPIHCCRL